MHKTLDIRSVFQRLVSSFRIPHRLVFSNEIAPLAVLFFFVAAVFFFRLLRFLCKSPGVTASRTTAPDCDKRATKELSETRAKSESESTSRSSPLPDDIPPSRKSFLSSIIAMIAAPIIARPVPMPEPPPTLVDRTIEVAPKLEKPESPWPVVQPYDAFLVLDVEATCQEGTDFNWPNEIIVSDTGLCMDGAWNGLTDATQGMACSAIAMAP